MKTLLIMLLVLPVLAAAPADEERAILKQVEVDAGVAEVWAAWTTPEGITTFFAPACNVELRVGGPYEIFFFPDNEPGYRGAENLHVLDFREGEMLSFEWNAPPQWPEVRAQPTRVTITLETTGDGRTLLTLVHDRWREGDDWEEAFDYFQEAWDRILGRLQHRFAVGPIDWEEYHSSQRDQD